MASEGEGQPWRLFLTDLARWIETDAWVELPRWWRGQLASRMLDTADAAARERLYQQRVMLAELMQAIENLVETNRSELDGRRERFRRSAGGVKRAGGQAGGKSNGARSSNRRAPAGDAGGKGGER